MARRQRQSRLQTVKDINITPLMDLTFLLLIVFMITAPMLEYGVDVSPPKMDGAALPAEKTTTITLDRQGDIHIAGDVMGLPQLPIYLQRLAMTDPRQTILVRAHEDRAYKEVIEIMKQARRSGLANISLVTEAEGR